MDLGTRPIVWLRVGPGLASLAGDASLWDEPAAVRKALLELLGVFPATHVEIDLDSVRSRPAGDGSWEALLAGGGEGKAYLAELWAAVGDGLRGRAEWGLALPDPRAAAVAAGDGDKAVLKSGLQLAGFLRHVRETSLAFVTLDLAPDAPAGVEKALAPVLRNGQLYGWSRAVAVAPGEVERWASFADAVLVRGDSAPTAIVDRPVLGGLASAFWAENRIDAAMAAARLAFGVLPADVAAKEVVERGRALREAIAG